MDTLVAGLFPARGRPATATGERSSIAAVGHNAAVARDQALLAVLDGTPHSAGEDGRRLHSTDIIELYRRYGDGFVDRLRGAFAVALIDESRGRAVLAIDRLGRRPLAWTTLPDGTLVFGTTVTAVRAARADAQVDPQSLYAYLYFHVIPSPATVYAGIAKLEPAHRLTLDNNQAALDRYWAPDFDSITTRPKEELEEQLRGLVRSSIARVCDTPATGAFLSGGIDSSTVSGMLRKIRGQPVKCFTIGFDSEGYDELEFARIASAHFDNELVHYYVTPEDVLESLPEIAGACDEPFGNASALPALYCARLAREHGIDLLLAGDGGDELFAGNERYRKQMVFDWYARLPSPLKRFANMLADRSPGPGARGLQRLYFYVDKSRAGLPRRVDLAHFLTNVGAGNVFTPHFLEAAGDTDRPASDTQGWYDSAPGGSSLSRMLYLDWKLTLADNDLRKVTNMCTLAGVAVEYPLLDDSLVDFSTQLDAATLMPKLRLRHFFKESMRGFLPDDVIDKSKHGFGLPFGQWLLEHEGLAHLVDDAFARLLDRRIVRADFLDWLRTAHREQHASYYGTQIWLLVMLELWLTHHAPDTAWS